MSSFQAVKFLHFTTPGFLLFGRNGSLYAAGYVIVGCFEKLVVRALEFPDFALFFYNFERVGMDPEGAVKDGSFGAGSVEC